MPSFVRLSRRLRAHTTAAPAHLSTPAWALGQTGFESVQLYQRNTTARLPRASCASANPRALDTPTGSWGGEHVVLSPARDTGAAIGLVKGSWAAVNGATSASPTEISSPVGSTGGGKAPQSCWAGRCWGRLL